MLKVFSEPTLQLVKRKTNTTIEIMIHDYEKALKPASDPVVCVEGRRLFRGFAVYRCLKCTEDKRF